MNKQTIQQELTSGLQSLAAAAFPRRCRYCGRRFSDLEAFLVATQEESAQSYPRPESEKKSLVRLFRNCPCGQPLHATVADRRDDSPHGKLTRAQFTHVCRLLERTGLTPDQAQENLQELLNGRVSPALQKLGIE